MILRRSFESPKKSLEQVLADPEIQSRVVYFRYDEPVNKSILAKIEKYRYSANWNLFAINHASPILHKFVVFASYAAFASQYKKYILTKSEESEQENESFWKASWTSVIQDFDLKENFKGKASAF